MLISSCILPATQSQEAIKGTAEVSPAPNRATLFQRAEIHLQKGQKDVALKVFAELERELPKSSRLALLFGTLLAKYEFYLDAQTYFAQALVMEPGLYDAYYNSALAYLRMDQPAKAVDVLAQVRTEDRSRGDFRNLLGNAYWKLEEVDKAAAELQRAYVLEPENEDYYLDAGSFFLHFNTPRPAVDIFRAGLRRVPNSRQLHFALGVALILIEMHTEAQQHLQQAILEGPRFPPALFALAYSYFYSGQYENAETTLRNYVRLLPDDYRAYYFLALSLKNQREKTESGEIERLLERCLALDPDYAPAHFELGAFYSRRREYHRTIKSLQRATSIDPEFLEAHVLLTTAYVRAGNSEAARHQSEIVRKLQQKVHAKQQSSEHDPTRRTLDYFIGEVGPRK